MSCSISDLESEPGLFISNKEVLILLIFFSELRFIIWSVCCFHPISLTEKIHSIWQKVFAEADAMARKYKEKLPSGLAPHKSELSPTNALPFENEVRMYANWKWFKFEREYEPA